MPSGNIVWRAHNTNMKGYLYNREVHLMVLGLAVLFACIVWLVPAGFNPWIVGTFCVVVIGTIKGWIYHRLLSRERQARDKAISDIQLMLKDQINSQLTVIESMSNLREIRNEEAHQARDYITKSVNTISSSLHELSEDSLVRWQRRYRVDARDLSLPLK